LWWCALNDAHACLSIHELVVDFFFPTAEETILLVYGSSIFSSLFFFSFFSSQR
jgi:hypothetical protein